VRILHNLRGVAQRSQDAEGVLRYLNAIVAVSPDAGQERFLRALILLRSGRRTEAIADADWLLERHPEGVNLNEVDELRRVLERLE
jgi:serine protease Do